MKNIKLVAFAAMLFLALSCGKNFDNLNVDPNNPSEVPVEFLLTNLERTFSNEMYGPNTQVYSCALWGQYFSQNNYSDESRYQVRPYNINYRWVDYYANVMEDCREIGTRVAASPIAALPVGKNKIAIAKILESDALHQLTDIFGPVPQMEILLGAANRTPKYEPQKDIYLQLLRDLKAAVAQLDETAESFGSADVIYGGDVAKWKKYANSLILRIALRMSDAEPDMARQEVEAAFAGAIMDNADNAYFFYLNAPPNNNPNHQFRVERIDADWGMSKTLIDNTLMPLSDPRLPAFADEKIGGGYAGRPFGQSSGTAAGESPDLYSQPSGAAVVREGRSDFGQFDVLSPTAPGRFFSYPEVCFIMAEGLERGWTLPGSAAEWYEKGIRASLEEWGITDGVVKGAYVNQLDVDYQTAPGDWKQKIGVQKWIALFLHGQQGWNEWRRLDFQRLVVPVDGILPPDFDAAHIAPLRIPFPSDEQTLNGANYQAAVTLLGEPDKLGTRVWWDTH